MTFDLGIQATLDAIGQARGQATIFSCGCRLHLLGADDPTPDWHLCPRHRRLERTMHVTFVEQYGACASRAA